MIMLNEIIIAKILNGPKHIMNSQDDFKFLKLDSMGPEGNTLATYDNEPITVFGGIPEEEVIEIKIKKTDKTNIELKIEA